MNFTANIALYQKIEQNKDRKVKKELLYLPIFKFLYTEFDKNYILINKCEIIFFQFFKICRNQQKNLRNWYKSVGK